MKDIIRQKLAIESERVGEVFFSENEVNSKLQGSKSYIELISNYFDFIFYRKF